MGNSYKPKVLLVHNFYQISGGEDTVFNNEKKLLEDNGHEVMTYQRNNEEINDFHFWEKLYYPLNTIFSLRTYKEVKDIIIRNQIDIVHVHNTWPLISPSVYYAAYHSQTPVVQTVHNFRLICPGGTLYFQGLIDEGSLYNGLWYSVKNKIYKNSYIHSFISAITLKIHRVIGSYKNVNFIFLNEFNKNKVLELNNNGLVIDDTKTYVKPNFVPKMENKYNPKDYYIFIGRLEEYKGLITLISAFMELPDLKLIIVGSGSLEKEIKESVKNYHNIELVGQKPADEVNNLLKNSKALIFPSQYYEPFGMVVIEAYSNGTPVIASDLGNLKELVIHDVTGLRFQHDSVESLQNAIIKFEKINMANISVNAHEFYRKKYSSEKNYSLLETIYYNILNS